MIKYIGSKRLLVPLISEVVQNVMPEGGDITDLFSGTSRVGHALKGLNYKVIANDHNKYAETLATCYVQADLEDHNKNVEMLVKEFNSTKGSYGYFTETFCHKSRYLQPKNGERVDAIRELIESKDLEEELKAIMLTSLMEAADRVDSTTGVQMAYLKNWAKRSFNNLELRVPKLLPRAHSGKGLALRLDGLEAVEKYTTETIYMDPPYNQHKYIGNYHVWETLVTWDKPAVYGVACKRVDVKDRPSDFNSKVRAQSGMSKIINSCNSKHIILSFSDEGYISKDSLTQMLGGNKKFVHIISNGFDRYIGYKNGVHNPQGMKTGTPSHLRNTEYLFIATDSEDVYKRVRDITSKPLT